MKTEREVSMNKLIYVDKVSGLGKMKTQTSKFQVSTLNGLPSKVVEI